MQIALQSFLRFVILTIQASTFFYRQQSWAVLIDSHSFLHLVCSLDGWVTSASVVFKLLRNYKPLKIITASSCNMSNKLWHLRDIEESWVRILNSWRIDYCCALFTLSRRILLQHHFSKASIFFLSSMFRSRRRIWKYFKHYIYWQMLLFVDLTKTTECNTSNVVSQSRTLRYTLRYYIFL